MKRTVRWSALRSLGTALALTAAILIARAAIADPSALIAVVRDQETNEPTLTRLRSELDALGLRVVEVEAPAEDRSPRGLERAAREVGAFAALRIVPWERGIEVWIADRVTGKTVLRELVVAPGEATDEVVALRAVELLRASLLELELPHKQSGDVPPPPAVKRMVSRPEPAPPGPPPATPPRFGVGLGAGPLLSPGGIDPSWQILLKARFVIAPRWGLELCAMLPTLPSTLEQPEGSADISIFFVGSALTLDLLPEPSHWTARAALGVGGVALRMVGSANELYVGRTDNVLVALPYTHLDLLYDIATDVRLGASIWAGVALPRATITFADRQVASWGRPAGAATAALEVDF
jgi:hypothetical protein